MLCSADSPHADLGKDITFLDFLQENASDVQPNIIHADTQGQSAAIFGLAHLLGIQLQPRIRNWKDLHFFRPDPTVRYEHIDVLFTKQIYWELIESMLPEMLRVALSIGAGCIKPSTILRRLATYSRKNQLYFAFRELDSVVRTIFLLEYIFSIELRRTIQAATNKSEVFNLFVQWVVFGGGRLLADKTRDERLKRDRTPGAHWNGLGFCACLRDPRAGGQRRLRKV